QRLNDRAISFGAGGRENGGNGAQQNFQIKPQRPVINVFEVEPHPLLKVRDLVASADLPEAGDAGLHAQAAAVGQVVETSYLVHRQRTRTHEAHFTAQDIEELRQFVEAVTAEPFANARDARVIGHLEDGAAHFVHRRQFVFELLGVGDHGAEFVKRERHTTEAGALLLEEDRTWRSTFDGGGNQQEQGRKQNQQHQRAEEVHEHLDQALPGGFRRGAKDQQGTAEQFIQARARDLRSKKIGNEPGIDALEFADFDDAFNPLEIRLFGADDDAAGGMLMEQFNESLQWCFDKVKLAHDF